MAAMRRVVLVGVAILFLTCIIVLTEGADDGGQRRLLRQKRQNSYINANNVNGRQTANIGVQKSRNIPNKIPAKAPGTNFGAINPNAYGKPVAYDNMNRLKENPNVPHSANRIPIRNELPQQSLTYNTQRKHAPVKIADHAACQNDVKTLCMRTTNSMTNNFAVLDCFQNDVKPESISLQCQHFVWSYKYNLTQDIRFDSAAGQVCEAQLEKFADCRILPQGVGQRIPCLMDHKTNITNGNCLQFLKRMASIIFSDYRLVQNFGNACKKDIDGLRCGRIIRYGDGDDIAQHSQGKTIECLSKQVKNLDRSCKHEILRIAELQADDYHLDRPLFYACRDDRERFCKRTSAGAGKIYKCLFRHKFEPDMSQECRQQLVRRQKVIREDYKADKGLTQACRHDIHQLNCMHGQKKNFGKFREAKLSHLLLCLEGALKENHQLKPECIAEMRDWRRALMEDYKVTPDIVTGCVNDIREHCDGGLHRNGVTLHCLMDLYKPTKKLGQMALERKITPTCKAALKELLREADVAEDVRIDPTLLEACQPVIDTACRDYSPGEGRIINCLMEQIGEKHMTDECEERLMEIQYFAARDFKLDARLYKYCQKDASSKCHADEHWFSEKTGVENGPVVFQCLHNLQKHFQHDPDKQLSRACAFEVRRVMRQRAISVDLEPRIELPCLGDLGQFCSDNTGKGKEMECLQENFDNLKEECQWAVGNFTQDEDEDLELDKVLMRACTPMIKKFCHELLENDDAEPGDVMECLITNKHHGDMNRKCQTGIEHHQLINLKDYRFTYKFKEACKKDVLKHCKGVKQKADVVRCLSEMKMNDTLRESEQRLSKPCRKQLRFELLSRNEDIHLDQNLEKQCKKETKTLCSNVSPGNAQIINCLKKHAKVLSEPCHLIIFKRQKEEALDNSVDYTFIKVCKNMIKLHCSKVNPKETRSCLKNVKDDFDFDLKCRKVLENRQVIENQDIRLNPTLMKACKMDIPKFCRGVLQEKNEDDIMQARVINCLRTKFAAKRLSHNCENHIRILVKESALDVQQDPMLADKCDDEINRLCKDDDGKGSVEECLKVLFYKKKIFNKECNKEVARLINENKADVFVDPLLHRACLVDLQHYCVGVPPGEGRQMSCLLAALDDTSVKLKPDCEKRLAERKEMWEYAAKIAPPENIIELMGQMKSSPARHYFAAIILAFTGIIFFGGIFCGRVSKRVRAELKNR